MIKLTLCKENIFFRVANELRFRNNHFWELLQKNLYFIHILLFI